MADVGAFLQAVGRLVKPGGLMVIGTLNRTPQSYVKAIVGAEYVLRWLPRGTHDWAKFVRPDEVHRHVAPLGFEPVEIKGCRSIRSRSGGVWATTRASIICRCFGAQRKCR